MFWYKLKLWWYTTFIKPPEYNHYIYEEEPIDNDWWEHYCSKEKDIMGFQKGKECDWCGAKEDD